MKSIIIISITAGVGLGLLSPSDVAAEDRKSYHATQCQATDGIESAFNRSEYRITRVGAGSGALLCPVVRDTWDCGGLLGGCVMYTEAIVQVHDGHFTGNVSCSLSARSETGSSLYYETDTTALAPGNAELVMGVGWPSGEGAYALKCSMPTNDANGIAKIYGYAIDEPS